MGSGDESGSSATRKPGTFIDILIAVVESNTGSDSTEAFGLLLDLSHRAIHRESEYSKGTNKPRSEV